MRKKIILTAIVLIIALLCVCLCAACNDKGIGGNGNGNDGGNGDNGNNGESVFSPDMSLDEFVDVMCGIDNYTLTMNQKTVTEDENEQVYTAVLKNNGKVAAYESLSTGESNFDLVAERYLFSENEIDYRIERSNYYYDNNLRTNVAYPDGDMVIDYNDKCMSNYDANYEETCVTFFVDYASADRYSKYTDKYVKFPSIDYQDMMSVYIFLTIAENNGKLASSGFLAEDCSDDANATEYLEVKDSGIVVGCNYIYEDKQQCIEFCIKDVGTTQVDIPDDVRSKKDESKWCDSFEYNYVEYRKGVYTASGYEDKYEATVQIYKRDEKTIVTVEPVVNGLPVNVISFTGTGVNDAEKAQNYEIRLYCDRQGNYCGEYEYLGQVKFGINISAYADFIKYYGEW